MTLSHFSALQKKALLNRSENSDQRIHKLNQIQKWIQSNESLILKALMQDFKKPHFETQISEILPVLSEISFFKKNLKRWMKNKRVSTPLSLFGHRSHIRYENKGVVLIISPWNYPFQLALNPLVAAIGAGNTAVIKPSEMTPATSLVIQMLVQDCFSENEAVVELGAKEKTEELLCYKFNHVFFTGSTQVGRVIAKSCAERLISMTLELGGKSPTLIDETADLVEAADKVFWGKFLNRGQTCVAPDYILIHEGVYEKFKTLLEKLIIQHAGDEKGQLISEHHRKRIQAFTHSTESVNDLSLTLLTDSKISDPVMQEEIFGPVLPLIKYKEDFEIFELVRKNESPLSLYIFSKRADWIEKILCELPSGGVGINSVVLQFANHHLPFGGVGESGMGRYHGHYGFLELSHQRAVLVQSFLPQMRVFLQPPYTSFKAQLIQVIKWLSTSK
jgi:aldehyde dehydrogenase (NAD+)